MHVIATAGHVDHGKSTLIRLITGMEPDRWSEERRRGMTIDLGFAWTRMPDGCVIAFVDVPGHQRFVTNMLAGAGAVPAVMFVVAADEGWMPQSAEHRDALHALGVQHGVLVVTRCDLADPGPALAQAGEALRGTSLSGMPAVTVSGETGQGADELRRALDELAHALPAADHNADVRLWVDRAFTIRGAGTVVTGTLREGTLRAGQVLRLGRDRDVVVRGLHSLGAPVPEAFAVSRVAVNLRGVRHDEIRRGDTLLTRGKWLHCDLADVRVTGTPAHELHRHLTLHIGSASVPVRVRPLGADTARLSLARALPLRIGDRGALRDPGRHSVPGGIVILDVLPPALTRRGAARERAAVLDALTGTPDSAGELHRRGMIRANVLHAMGVASDAAEGWLIDEARREELAERLTELVQRHQQENPLQDGMPAEAARRALDLPEALLPLVAETSAAELSEGRLRLGDTSLPEPERSAVDTVRARLAHDPFAAPTADDLRELGLGDQALAAAVRTGDLLKLAPGVFVLPSAPAQAADRLREVPEPFTLSDARRALGTTRRVAVPLMELLDRQGHTEPAQDGTRRFNSPGQGIPEGRTSSP